MPLFEFRCPKCQAQFEKITSRQSADDVACPECGQQPAERLLSTFATSSDSASGGSLAASPAACSPRGGFS
jgi:putative FmdB family regulatory protein